MNQARKTLGIIGGMGPQATVDLFARIVAATPARRDQEHLHILIDNDPSIPDRTAAIAGRGPSPLPQLIAAGRRLVEAGAEFLAMPCNTAHHWHGELAAAVGAPVLHMLNLAAEEGRARWPRAAVYGLLATTGTVESGLYQKAFAAHKLEMLIPTPDEQETLVMEAIYGPEGVKAGTTGPAPRGRADLAIEALVERGAEVVVLGCTELPLLYPGGRSEFAPLLDPTETLARACVACALGKAEIHV